MEFRIIDKKQMVYQIIFSITMYWILIWIIALFAKYSVRWFSGNLFLTKRMKNIWLAKLQTKNVSLVDRPKYVQIFKIPKLKVRSKL